MIHTKEGTGQKVNNDMRSHDAVKEDTGVTQEISPTLRDLTKDQQSKVGQEGFTVTGIICEEENHAKAQTNQDIAETPEH